MREVLLERHGRTAPATYNKGSAPIDGVFVTSTIQITKGGYLGNGEGVGDHRCRWIDLEFATAFGHEPLPLAKPG